MTTAAIKATSVVVAVNMAEKQAAEYLAISVFSLRRWRVYGGGPRYLKMGSRVVYPIVELDAFQAACMRKSTSDQGAAEKTSQIGKQTAKLHSISTSIETPSVGLFSPEKGKGGDLCQHIPSI